MKMLNDIVAVIPIQETEQKVGSLYVAESNPFEQAEVKAVPDDYSDIVKPGNVVLFSRGAGNNVTVDGVRYRFVSIRDFKSIIDEKVDKPTEETGTPEVAPGGTV